MVLMVNNLYLSFILIPQNTPPFLFTFLSIITIIIIIIIIIIIYKYKKRVSSFKLLKSLNQIKACKRAG